LYDSPAALDIAADILQSIGSCKDFAYFIEAIRLHPCGEQVVASARFAIFQRSLS